LSSAGADRLFGTRDHITFDSVLERRRVAELAGCYVLAAKLRRLNADTLRLSTKLEFTGYAIDSPITMDSIPVPTAFWYPGPLDSLHASWIHVDDGVTLEGRVTGGKLSATTHWQSVTGRQVKC
jgi:hypothetical protein